MSDCLVTPFYTFPLLFSGQPMNSVLQESIVDPPNSPSSELSSPCTSCLGEDEEVSSDELSIYTRTTASPTSDLDSATSNSPEPGGPQDSQPSTIDILNYTPNFTQKLPITHTRPPHCFYFFKPVLSRPIVSIDPFNCHRFIFSSVNALPEHDSSVYGTAQFLTESCPGLLKPLTVFVDWINTTVSRTLKTPPIYYYQSLKVRDIVKNEPKDLLVFHFLEDPFIDLTFNFDLHPGQKFIDPEFVRICRKDILDELVHSLCCILNTTASSRAHRVKHFLEVKPFIWFLKKILQMLTDKLNAATQTQMRF